MTTLLRVLYHLRQLGDTLLTLLFDGVRFLRFSPRSSGAVAGVILRFSLPTQNAEDLVDFSLTVKGKRKRWVKV
jgi:hypothetical protein